MPAKIKHLAISSAHAEETVKFYETLFGLKRNRNVVSDGYVGINVNGRGPGRQAGFDHFGMEVDDIERVAALAAERFPNAEYVRRPSTRPFASFSMNDPDGNVFDLTQSGMENRRDLYAENADLGERARRHVSHVQLRTVHPDVLVQFYREVFALEGEGYHLSDGTVTFVVTPWHITDYAGMGISRPALDHIGFEVESLEQFDKDLAKLQGTEFGPRMLEARAGEGEARLKLFQTCPYGQRHFADPDCVLIDVGTR